MDRVSLCLGMGVVWQYSMVRAENHVVICLSYTTKDSSLIFEGKQLHWAHRRGKPEWVVKSPAINHDSLEYPRSASLVLSMQVGKADQGRYQ